MGRDVIRTSHIIHQKTLERVSGEWVRYVDGSINIRVRAVRGGADPVDVAGDGDFTVSSRQLDWLIRTSLMQTEEGAAITPRAGALIIPEDESDADQYELTNGPTGDCFEYSDTRQTRMRIHTDRVN